MLARIVRPDGKEVSFAYDAIGRRIRKSFAGTTTHFVWDGNVPLHEWTEENDVVTWLFEQDTFVPAAKLVANGDCFSIVSDYLGTPQQAYDKEGNKVWEQELDRAEFYAKSNKSTIIAINTDKIEPKKIIDISNGIDPQTGKPLQGKAFGYATKDAEVLIDGEIPKEAYTVVKKHH